MESDKWTKAFWDLDGCRTCQGLDFSSTHGKIISINPIDVWHSALRLNGCPSCKLIRDGFRSLGYNLLIFLGVFINVSYSSNCVEIKICLKQGCMGTNCSLMDLELYALPDESGSRQENHRLTKSAISGDTSSDEALSNVQGWIQECLKSHTRCHVEKSCLPTRVLDLGESNIDLKLYESEGESENYACLSHCWGDNRHLLTTKANLDQHKLQISLSALPKTWQDSVQLCRRLRIRYLWIDSLCIVQDDKDDWVRESSKMAEIYQFALITIAATSSTDGSGGLFRKDSDKSFESHWLTELLLDGEPQRKCQVFIRRELPHYEDMRLKCRLDLTPLRKWPLLTRAWVFQEMFLSPRVLHFNSYELTWECLSSSRCECSEYNDGSKMRRAILFSQIEYYPDLGHIEWLKMIEEYSRMNLTYESDRLVALSGAAKYMQRWNGQYLAGNWRDDLPKALLWTTSVAVPEGELLSHRPRKWRAPTWSWASVEGPIWFEIKPWQIDISYHIDIIEAECIAASPDPTGPVAEGHLLITGYPLPATLFLGEIGTPTSRRIFNHERYLIWISESKCVYIVPNFNANMDMTKDQLFFLDDCKLLESSEDSEIDVICIAVALAPFRGNLRSWSLVLKRQENNPMIYERIGLAVSDFDESREDTFMFTKIEDKITVRIQ